MERTEKKNLTSRREFLVRSGLAAATIPLIPLSCREPPKEELRINNSDSFEFAFLTDIHIKPEMNAPLGFQMAIDKVNALKPDFVLTGGDLVYDAMRGDQTKCESLFQLYKDMTEGFHIPVYNCIGNHDCSAYMKRAPNRRTIRIGIISTMDGRRSV